MIRIKSKKDGFRRCGIAHSTAPADYPVDRFTSTELAILKAEPMLSVEDVPKDQGGDGSNAPAGNEGATAPGRKAAEVIEQIRAAETVEAVKALVAGESRRGVLSVAEKRIAELSPRA